MIENKVYTPQEMMYHSIYTDDYCFMTEPCDVEGTLVLKAESRKPGILRVFFQLCDGRKIITPVFWWQKYLDFYNIDIGTLLRLTYQPGRDGEVYLAKAEKTEQ